MSVLVEGQGLPGGVRQQPSLLCNRGYGTFFLQISDAGLGRTLLGALIATHALPGGWKLKI